MNIPWLPLLALTLLLPGPARAEAARDAAQHMTRTGDHRGAPFIVIDKVQARLWLFDARGEVRANTAVLLGSAHGDHSVPGIGERPLSAIAPHERTTPAGRFVAEPGRNLRGEDIIWVDYDAAVSIHRLRPHLPEERRAQRLASPTPADNRITYGCINVPPEFYDRWLAPLILQVRPVVRVLPETQPRAH